MERPSPPPQASGIQQALLQSLYAIFLGGIITAFLFVGVTTFYPQSQEFAEAAATVEEQTAELYDCRAETDCSLTPQEEQQARELQERSAELWKEQQALQRTWSRTAGLVLIVLATGLLALSLVRTDRAIALANGLLLGGLFTMVGGIGLSIVGGEGVVRFLVLAFALATTLVLGYLRFARVPVSASAAEDPSPPGAGSGSAQQPQ